MTKRWNVIVRRVGPVLSAGVLFQASGCAIDPAALTQELVTAVVNNLIASIALGVFDIPLAGF